MYVPMKYTPPHIIWRSTCPSYILTGEGINEDIINFFALVMGLVTVRRAVGDKSSNALQELY